MFTNMGLINNVDDEPKHQLCPATPLARSNGPDPAKILVRNVLRSFVIVMFVWTHAIRRLGIPRRTRRTIVPLLYPLP